MVYRTAVVGLRAASWILHQLDDAPAKHIHRNLVYRRHLQRRQLSNVFRTRDQSHSCYGHIPDVVVGPAIWPTRRMTVERPASFAAVSNSRSATNLDFPYPIFCWDAPVIVNLLENYIRPSGDLAPIANNDDARHKEELHVEEGVCREIDELSDHTDRVSKGVHR